MNANDKPDVTVQVQLCTINTDEYFDYFLLMPDLEEDHPWAGCLIDDIPEIVDHIYDDLCNKALGEHKWTLDLYITFDKRYCDIDEYDINYSYNVVKLELCNFDAEVKAYKDRNKAPVEESDWDFEPNEEALEDKEGLL